MEILSRVNRLPYRITKWEVILRFPTLRDNSGDNGGDKLEIYSSLREEDKLQAYDKVLGKV